MTEDEQAIRHVVATWMEASQSGDTATALSLMTEDAIFMVSGQDHLAERHSRQPLVSPMERGRRLTGGTTSLRFKSWEPGRSHATVST